MNIKVGGKEYGLIYDVEAFLKFSDYVATNGSSVSMARANMMQMVFMSESYAKAHNTEALKSKDLMQLPVYEIKELLEIAKAQALQDSERTVEAEAPKGKNAGSATK